MRAEAAAPARPPRITEDADRQKLAMAGFFRIMELWGASNAQMRRILGQPAERTFYEWKSGRVRRLPEDTLRRIGYVAGTYKALQIVYADPAQADQWVQKPNRHFGGQTPLERLAAGDVTDLAAVRAYLDPPARPGPEPRLRRIGWAHASRIIAARYPPFDLFERVSHPIRPSGRP